jgi:hypothetical protein
MAALPHHYSQAGRPSVKGTQYRSRKYTLLAVGLTRRACRKGHNALWRGPRVAIVDDDPAVLKVLSLYPMRPNFSIRVRDDH